MFLGSKTNISKDKILEDFEVEINKPQKENNK
jgi:hypothetical protein